MSTRFKEHLRCIKNKEIEKSAVAYHFWNEGHDPQEPVLIKHISNQLTLDIWEKLLIYKNKSKLFNFDVIEEDILYRTLDIDSKNDGIQY